MYCNYNATLQAKKVTPAFHSPDMCLLFHVLRIKSFLKFLVFLSFLLLSYFKMTMLGERAHASRCSLFSDYAGGAACLSHNALPRTAIYWEDQCTVVSETEWFVLLGKGSHIL